MAAAASGGGTAERKRPTCARSARATTTTTAAAAAVPFRGVSASADPEAHLVAANDLLAAEVMDGRLWFAACADGEEGEDGGEERDGKSGGGGGCGGSTTAAAPAPPSSSAPSSSPPSLPPVPASFPSPRAYVSAFLPLVIEEARQEVRSSWVEAVSAGRSWPVRVESAAFADEEEGGGGGGVESAAFADEEEEGGGGGRGGGEKGKGEAAAAAIPEALSSASRPPPPAAEVRLRFPGARRPPPGALRDGDVVVITRGLPSRGGGGGEALGLEPLDWAAGGRRRVAAAGVELEEGELASDAAAATAAAAAAAMTTATATTATTTATATTTTTTATTTATATTTTATTTATATGQQLPPVPAPTPPTSNYGACPVAGVIRYSGGVVTLSTRCRCPRHRRERGNGGEGEGDALPLPPCVAALRSLAAASSSSSSSSSSKQDHEPHQWYLTVVGNLVTHAREVAALFAVPAMPLARALISPKAVAAAARAAVGGVFGDSGSSSAAARWPAEASSAAFVGRLKETYDHAQLRAIEVAACHLSAGGGGGGGGGSGRGRSENEIGPDASRRSPPPPPPSRPTFTLVQGPPGTGKTHTVTGILNVWHLVAYQRHFAVTVEALTRESSAGNGSGGLFTPGLSASWADAAAATATTAANASFTAAASKPRLLVCAPSNAAADELLSRVMDRGFFDGRGSTYRPDVVRVGADAAPMAARAREVWVEGIAAQLLEMPPAERASRLQEARVRGARERRRVAAAREALRLSSFSSLSSSTLAAAETNREDAAAAQAAAVELARAADAADKADALVERLEVADQAARAGSGAAGDKALRRREKERLEASLVSRAEMVFTTLSSTGRRVFQQLASAAAAAAASNGNDKKSGAPPFALFDTVLVDEAAQATEPATLQALRFGARSCVLVGDPRQLPATVLSGKAARAGLARSLFERLANGEGRGEGGGAGGGGEEQEENDDIDVDDTKVPVSLLRVQYRMHAEIRSFPSRAFYAGALEDAESVRRRAPEPWHGHPLLKPYVFFDVARGREARGRGSAVGGASPFFASGALSSSSSSSSVISAPSLHNDEEAALAAALVAELRGQCERLGCPYPVVGVITPYRAQAAALRSALESAGGGPRGREWCRAVETVDGFQGKEVDVAIVSCVRTRGGGGNDFARNGGGGGGGGKEDGGAKDGDDDDAAAIARALSAALASSTFSYSSSSNAAQNPTPPSSAVGFVDDLRRLNVAVTRARRALWVLGSGEALRRGSAAWAALLADAARRGLVVRGADAAGLFPGWWAGMQQVQQQQKQERRGRGRGGGRG